MTQSYAGDISPKETWQLLEAEPGAVLVDVRTQAEWNYVGVPDLSRLGKSLVRIQWQSFPDGKPNPHFAEEFAASGVPKDQKVLLLCRSGQRSRAAAQLLTQLGWEHCYNVADGFEGGHDAERHRGTTGGWKHDGLPWVQG
jgi:rhodanese-related sulfurtransferase